MEVSEPPTKLKEIQPNIHLRVSLSIIYFMGTWPPKKYRRLYLVYTICSLTFILGIFLITEMAELIQNWGDVPKMVAGVTLLMTNYTHFFKVFFILYHQKRIQILLDITKDSLFSRDNNKYERIVTKYTWQGIIHHSAYQSFGTMAVLGWGFTPINDLINGRSRQLPMGGWYPYNTTRTPAFEITSIHQTVALVIACFHNVAMDTLITGFITVACCQLAILQRNIVALYSAQNEKDTENNYVRNNKSYSELKRCVRHSNAIFDFTREIQDIFGTIIFLQFLVNCIIICFAAFNLSQMKVYVPSLLIATIMYICCMTYQIFIFCWHGNELHLHSTKVIMAAYSSSWWQGNKKFKQALQIIMLRSGRPLTLSAGKVMSLSLQTFVQILRTSYSIFTVLQSTTVT